MFTVFVLFLRVTHIDVVMAQQIRTVSCFTRFIRPACAWVPDVRILVHRQLIHVPLTGEALLLSSTDLSIVDFPLCLLFDHFFSFLFRFSKARVTIKSRLLPCTLNWYLLSFGQIFFESLIF